MKKQSDNQTTGERLQKILANAGVCSRRKAEELILDGRVSVNGRRVRVLGSKADPLKDEISVDGARIGTTEEYHYIALHKPPGILCAAVDDRGRPLVTDLVAGVNERIYPVGRLDFHSEGLLLLTNDGEFTNMMTHPRHHVPRLYRVKVKGRPSRQAIGKLLEGIKFKGQKLKAHSIQFEKMLAKNSYWLVELLEGKNRQIRRMFDAIDHEVKRLVRIRIGSLALGSLALGEWRPLKPREVTALKGLASRQPVKAGKRRLVR